ncbi:VOC family protein [Blastococcus sp. SYSU D01050]
MFVDDQAKALAFYTEKLGFTTKTDVPAGEARWLTVVSPADQGQVGGGLGCHGGVAGAGGQGARVGGGGPGPPPRPGGDLELGAPGQRVLDHRERAGAAGRRQLLSVQPQPVLVVVDHQGGDAEVGLEHVVVDRIAVGQGEGAPERVGRGRPVGAAGGEEPAEQGCRGPGAARGIGRGWGDEPGQVGGAR